MANGTNFLIGRGELLTYDIFGPQRYGKKVEVYSLAETRERLVPQFQQAAEASDKLPAEACPQDLAVAKIVLNPAYIAKSFFPRALFRSVGFEPLGNRNTRLVPKKWTKSGRPQSTSTTEIFVAAKRHVLRSMASITENFPEESEEARDLNRVEVFDLFSSDERIRTYGDSDERFFEVGIHLLPDEPAETIQKSFAAFAGKHDTKIHEDLGFQTGNLWFVPVEGVRNRVEALAVHAFVRVIRPMPRLRALRPISRSTGPILRCSLPSEQPLSSEPRVAVLDGGLPKDNPAAKWVSKYQVLDPLAKDDPDGIAHGLGVTSAFLFGPILPSEMAPRPYSYVDHVRVLDEKTSTEPSLELYRTLGFIEQVLLSRQYEFVNLSLGPDLPVEDGDVHAWTCVIDDLLSDGETFMTVAVGNNGELDRPSGNARIQVPADCVNATSVGAADRSKGKWRRAPYSAFGPGRSPGVIKPDVVTFGGSANSYFHVLTEGVKPQLTPQVGTSFAAPYILRTAVGIRAVLGKELRPLTIKALLVHCARNAGHHQDEVGWGYVSADLMSLISCPPGVARIVYQGELKPGKYLRAPLPLPKDGLEGRIKVSATFCYASPVDPQDASSYTCAGLEIAFRPNAAKLRGKRKIPATKGFFSLKKYATEAERRSDSGKWETVLHAERRMLGPKLDGPVFDIHYTARERGGAARSADKIAYALVITITAVRHQNIYSEILQAYPSVLIPLQPQITVPIRV